MVRISEAEFEVMKVIWEKKETTSIEIINILKEKGVTWNFNTIRTLIKRLLKKEAIKIKEKKGKTYTYIPVVEEKEYNAEVIKKYIDTSFNGSVLEFIRFIINIDNKYKEEIRKGLEESSNG